MQAFKGSLNSCKETYMYILLYRGGNIYHEVSGSSSHSFYLYYVCLHHDPWYSRSLSFRRSLQGIMSQTILLDDSWPNVYSIDGLSSWSGATYLTQGNSTRVEGFAMFISLWWRWAIALLSALAICSARWGQEVRDVGQRSLLSHWHNLQTIVDTWLHPR